MPQPGRAQPGRIALPQPRPRRDLDAPRPRRQGREHDDGRGAPSTGSRSGLLREPHRAGLRYAGRRPDVARASLARRRPGCLRGRLRMTMRFTDRVALITAAASGIGRATAEIIGGEGGIVVGVDTDKGRLEEAMGAIRRAGGQGHARPADALDPAQVRDVVDGVVREFGRVDILVNAVGGSTIIARPAALVDELTLAEWQRLITFNLDGTFLFCHTVGPVMKRQRGGKIVNISSIAGRGLSASSSSAYAAAKGGIIAFTRKLAHELGPFGVTVNAIAPSLTLTERIRPHWDRRTPEQQAAEIARTPLRRVAEAVGQARVICFLASRDLAERARIRSDAAKDPNWPPKIREFVREMRSEIVVPFSFVPEVRPGKVGPIFELRYYTLKPGTLPDVAQGWEAKLPERMKLSPVVLAGGVEFGRANGFVHVWAYSSLDQRARVRDEARQQGVWPPPGGPDRLLTQENKVLLPSAFSPLQ